MSLQNLVASANVTYLAVLTILCPSERKLKGKVPVLPKGRACLLVTPDFPLAWICCMVGVKMFLLHTALLVCRYGALARHL